MSDEKVYATTGSDEDMVYSSTVPYTVDGIRVSLTPAQVRALEYEIAHPEREQVPD